MSAYLQPSHSKERWWNSNASIFPCFLLSFFPPLFHSFLFFLSFCNSLFLHIINNYLVFPSSSCSSFFVNIFPFYLTFLLLISFFNSFLLLSFSLLSLWIYVWVRKRGGVQCKWGFSNFCNSRCHSSVLSIHMFIFFVFLCYDQ